jgi:hypothetical protein
VSEIVEHLDRPVRAPAKGVPTPVGHLDRADGDA